MAPRTRTVTKAADTLMDLKDGKKPKKDATDKKTEVAKELMNDSDLRARLKKKVIASRASANVDAAPVRPKRRIASSGEPAVVKTSKTKTKATQTNGSRKLRGKTAKKPEGV